MENSYIGVYPIICENETVGELNVSQNGAFLLFEATAEMRQELFRLSVYGPEGEGYLGVMLPEGGALTLKKRFSRAALRGFPTKITLAAPSGGGLSPLEATEEPPCEYEASAEDSAVEDEAPPGETYVSSALPPESIPPPIGSLIPCANPCSLFSNPAEKSLFGGVRGALAEARKDLTVLYIPAAEASGLGVRGVAMGDFVAFYVENGRLQ